MENEKNELLCRARKNKGWTQEDLAKKLVASKGAVKAWENGRRSPSPVFQDGLCKLFGMTAAELGLEKSEKEEQTVSVPIEQDQNRRSMLKRVQTRWISGILDHAKAQYQGNPIPVSLRERPDAVSNPWSTIAQESNLPSRSLSPNTRILEVYDEADGGILILGEPGAGKTTLLLELARDLIERARLDETHPMPAVFNLTSWAGKRSLLAAWFVDELQVKYQVPRKLAQTWVSANQILPLLDGLDEVAEPYRRECVRAINRSRKEQGFVPMVVCCRANEYLVLNAPLALNNAVTIEPLAWEEIERYVSKGGKSLQGVYRALQNDPGLREMASTPLMLHIIAQTASVISIDTLLLIKDASQRRALIFEKYVEIVLKRRGPQSRYSPEQTIHWLTWLATKMQEHNLTECYLERIQPDWLSPARRKKYHQTIEQLVYGLVGATISATFAWLRGGKIGNSSGVGAGLLGILGAGPGNTIFGWMAPGLGGAIEGGGTLGVVIATVFVIVTLLAGKADPLIQITWGRITASLRGGTINGLKGGIFIGGLCSLLFTLRDGLSGLSNGLSYGLFCALIIGLFSGLIAGLQYEEPTTDNKESIPKQRVQTSHTRLTNAAIFGLVSWISFALVNSVMVGINQGLLYGFIIGSLNAVILLGGGTKLIRTTGEIQPAETIKWKWHKQYLIQNGKIGISVGLFTLPCVSVVFSLASTLFHGLHYGLSYGLIYGLIVSCIVAIAGTLIGMLNTGWSATLLDERHILRPNEGIRLSVRNALSVAAMLGPLCGGLSGLVSGFVYGLFGGLSGASIIGIGFAITFTIIFTIIFALLRGGIACIQHYTLRWFLFRSNALPWNTIAFLEYACKRILLRRVGGGYIFSHRLILEYFASLEPGTK